LILGFFLDTMGAERRDDPIDRRLFSGYRVVRLDRRFDRSSAFFSIPRGSIGSAI
jgi:hypothetical protein